jgi:succinate dehydrogenase / fumarate reductase cytochrome b subunit
MAGNLQIFAGSEALNAYAQMLKHNPAVLWGARIFLLAMLLLHLWKAVTLKTRALAARPVAYGHPNTARASLASRTMVITGLVVLVFLVFHIAHYTLGIVHRAPDGKSYLDLRDSADPARHDVYHMVIAGFTTPWISVLYLLAQVPLFMHLQHGVGSLFQTLGLNTPRSNGAVKALSWLVAIAVCGGNALIVVGVWAGMVR